MTRFVPVTTFPADRTDARPSETDVVVVGVLDRTGSGPM